MDLLLSQEREKGPSWPFRRRRAGNNHDYTAREISRVLKILKELDIVNIWMVEFCGQKEVDFNIRNVLTNMMNLCSRECSHFIDRSLVWSATRQGRDFWYEKDREFTRLYGEKYGKKHNMFEW